MDFTPKANKQPLSQIPSLKIHVVEDEFNIEKHCELNINTPNKKELTQNGLDKFKPNLNILGKGTFGTVFKGKYQGELVAIKITSNSSKERNVLHLKHPNIVCTRDVIHSPNSKYDLVIMEFLPRSKTLQDTLYSLKKLPENLTEKKILLKGFAEGVSLGLDYLHSKGLLHLDLKPCNVLVTEESVCKICDFGNSTTIAECLQAYDCIGTPIYTAPELLLGGRPSTKSDVYSLGLIFWQIKHQQIPFAEYERVETVIYNVAKHGIRPCYSGNTEDELFKLISRCWLDRKSVV